MVFTAPWPEAAAGGGASLQRRFASDFGNDPLNWKAEPPTAGSTNTLSGRPAPPVITDKPQDQTVMVGSSVTLSVAAVGSPPMAYRWQRNGVDLPGATNDALVFSNAQPADSGSYQVWISNAVDLICSRSAALSVLAPPVITVQPFGLSVNLGATVTLRVTASGSRHWYSSGIATVAPIRRDELFLTLSGVDPTEAGTYEAVVSNPAGMAFSQPATLIVAGVDSDGDGIPDSWMMQHFGHSTGLASDRSRAQDDADGDGMSNLQEYLAGTDPRTHRVA